MSWLPPGWTRANVGAICLSVTKHDPRDRPAEEFDYIDIGGVDNQGIKETKRLTGANAPSRARQIVRGGDTVLSTVRTYLKKTALVPPELDGATASTGFCVLRPSAAIDSRFLFYRVIESRFVGDLSAQQTGSSYPAVRDNDVFEQPIELPPLNEQRRIVAAIEEQFSRLDAAEESLHRADQRVDAYKRSLIESSLPVGCPLVAVADIAAAEKHSITDGPFGSNLKTSHYRLEGPRVIRLQNIGDGEFIDEHAHISQEHFERLLKHEVRAGDLVIAALGNELPRACVIPDRVPPAIVKADCIRVRVSANVDARYASIALNSPQVRRKTSESVHGVGRPRLNLRE